MPITDVTIGYVLRCARPIPFDIDYTRTLGYGAVQWLLSQQHNGQSGEGCLVCLESGHLRAIPWHELRDPSTGRLRLRLVDLESVHYKVAREYMIRLEPHDLKDPGMKANLATAAKMRVDDLEETFAPLLSEHKRG